MRFLVSNGSLTREQVQEILDQPRDRIALDIETVSLENTIPLGIAIAVSPDLGFYFFNPRDEIVHRLVEQTPTTIIHNAEFDMIILDRLGHKVQHYEDTMMLAYSAGYLEKGLEVLSLSVLGRDCPSVTTQWIKKDQGNIAINHVSMGGMSIIHACNAYALWDRLPKTPLYYDIDRPCVDLVIEMERWGILIDQYQLTEVEQEAVVKAGQLELELLQELGAINLASNTQVAVALQAKGILGTRKTKAGKDSVSEESLKPLNHPIANKLLEWRSVMKTLTTYVPAFRAPDEHGRLHTSYGYTNTGRWNSSRPNLQNITRDEKFKETDND